MISVLLPSDANHDPFATVLGDSRGSEAKTKKGLLAEWKLLVKEWSILMDEDKTEWDQVHTNNAAREMSRTLRAIAQTRSVSFSPKSFTFAEEDSDHNGASIRISFLGLPVAELACSLPGVVQPTHLVGRPRWSLFVFNYATDHTTPSAYTDISEAPRGLRLWRQLGWAFCDETVSAAKLKAAQVCLVGINQRLTEPLDTPLFP